MRGVAELVSGGPASGRVEHARKAPLADWLRQSFEPLSSVGRIKGLNRVILIERLACESVSRK